MQHEDVLRVKSTLYLAYAAVRYTTYNTECIPFLSIK